MRKMIEQRPTEGNDWLYEERGKDDRYFTDVVYLPEGTPLWEQCTNAEKLAWDDVHMSKEELIEE